MVAIERDLEDHPETVEIIVRLHSDSAELLAELMKRTGWSASELIGWSLGAQWREMEGIVLPPPSHEDQDALIAEAEADVAAGRTIPHEEVMAEARKILER